MSLLVQVLLFLFMNTKANTNANYHNEAQAVTNEENLNNAEADDVVRIVQNPSTKINIKGRPRGALNKRTASQAFDNSTRREPSNFEYTELQTAEIGNSVASTGEKPRRGRPRGRSRGVQRADGAHRVQGALRAQETQKKRSTRVASRQEGSLDE